MKRFSFLILVALLFAGCNNMLTNPDAFNSEDATVSMDISQIKARLATDGVVLTSTLDFVGDEPKHAPFEKTQTINGNIIEYTVKGIPTGSTVQFKLSVFKNGILVFEGVSNKVTIKGKNNLQLGLEKNSIWISYYSAGSMSLSSFDANFTPLTDSSFDSNKLEIPGNLCTKCIDDKGNVYVLVQDGEYSIYRYAPSNKDPVCIVESIENYNMAHAILYDAGNDSLFILTDQNNYLVIQNASTTEGIASLDADSAAPLAVDINTFNEYRAAVYNNEFFWIEDGSGYCTIYKSTLEEGVSLFKYDSDAEEDDEKFSGVLVNELKSSFSQYHYNRFSITIQDIYATKEGVFVLISSAPGFEESKVNRNDPNEAYCASRGGIIKLSNNLTNAKLFGWTEDVYTLKGNSNSNGIASTALIFRQYVPKNKNRGFYGPIKVVAIKPKKLYFFDNGGWMYVDQGAKSFNIKSQLIEFDLESCSWNSIEGNFELMNSEFKGNFSMDLAPYTSFTETWE